MNYEAKVKELCEGKKAFIRTFGCQLNENDSEKLAGMLQTMGYVISDDIRTADLVLLNTCAIRENAEKKTFGAVGLLKNLKEKNPALIVVMAGCMTGETHVMDKLRATYCHVDIVLGSNNIDAFPRLLYTYLYEKERVFDTEYAGVLPEGLPTYRQDKFRASVPVMYGCNNFCAYCIVPYVRGRERSRKAADIVREVETLRDNGYMEVMLLGQNVNSYQGGGDAFARLLQQVSDTGIPRIRFMTSHPKDISDAVLDVMASRDNICKALHLPVQAGNNRVLAAMNRRYTREKYLSIVEKAREKMPDIVLTTDIIVGFPGETNEEFADTISLLKAVRYDMIFSFIFSPRQGTPAANMADVLTAEEKKRNFDQLLQVQNQISKEKNLQLADKILPVLVEGRSKTDATMMTGRTDGGKIVHFKGDDGLCGRIVDVQIQTPKTWNLQGEIVCHSN
ncbi:MAG: tRNA (N6-isopentenyl adenosine(37)-C2)-methylthiotransferase MiaB [Clostridia bacterium]|nr:tRNA (N6-isopentenyl adenosine(37)-C2)-methylthiotransferase MiaB [Clostridia bacterium]